MSDATHHCKSNLPTPSADAAERGDGVHPESARRPDYLPVIPEAIPADIKALRQWVSWNAEYQPHKSPTKPWSKVPKNPETGRHPTFRISFVIFTNI